MRVVTDIEAEEEPLRSRLRKALTEGAERLDGIENESEAMLQAVTLKAS